MATLRRKHIVLLTMVSLLALPTGAIAGPGGPSPAPAVQVAAPSGLMTTVRPGQKAIRVIWNPSAGASGYEVLVDGTVVSGSDPLPPDTRSYTASEGLRLGRTYDITVRAIGDAGHAGASREQTLYIAPVTTVQRANPDNPLAGIPWGVYLGPDDLAMRGWKDLGQADRDRLATFPMVQKSKFFGRQIADRKATSATREYIRYSQDGDPTKLTVLTMFRMFPWGGAEGRIVDRLPTKAEQASYRTFVTGVARGIGNDRVAIVLQPDGYMAKNAYEAWVKKVGRKRALLPARMLAWSAKTLASRPNTSVYVDMGSEDWARGKVGPVAKFLKLSGVKYARGFSLNVSHKNYLAREINFAKKVSRALARMGIKGKHAVLDTSDNGQPFHGSEINPPGDDSYTPPGEIGPCRTVVQPRPCTALGVPPTTDVDNPAWHLPPKVAKTAARYVDAYLWVSRPWLPNQGRGGTLFSTLYATLLLKTWKFSPFFEGTP